MKQFINQYLIQALVGFTLVILLGRYAVVELNIHPGATVILSTVFSGIILLIGGGITSAKTLFGALKSVYSWAYGFCRIGNTIAYTALLVVMTGAEVEILTKIYIPFAAISSWFLFRKPLGWINIPGFALVCGGVYLVFKQMEPTLSDTLPFLAVVVILVIALGHIVEVHPVGAEAKSTREKMAFTGAVQSVTALIWVSVTILVSFTFIEANQITPLLRPFIVSWSDIFDFNTLLFSIILISPFRAMAIYGALNSMRTMGVTGYFSALTALPVMVLIGEYLLNETQFLKTSYVDQTLFIALSIVVIGGLYNLYAENFQMKNNKTR